MYIDEERKGFGFCVELHVTVEIRILHEHFAFHCSNLLHLQSRA